MQAAEGGYAPGGLIPSSDPADGISSSSSTSTNSSSSSTSGEPLPFSSLPVVASALAASGVAAALQLTSGGGSGAGTGPTRSTRGRLAPSPTATPALSPPSRDAFLVSRPEFSSLYADLGITPLSEPSLLVRYVLPQFPSLAPPERAELMDGVRQRWKRLRGDAALVAALQRLAWVPVEEAPSLGHTAPASSDTLFAGPLACPTALTHPQHRLLRSLAVVTAKHGSTGSYSQQPPSSIASSSSSGAPTALAWPHPALMAEIDSNNNRSSSWSDLLIDLGMRISLDGEAVHAASLALQSCRGTHSEVHPEVASFAYALWKAVWSGEVPPATQAALAAAATSSWSAQRSIIGASLQQGLASAQRAVTGLARSLARVVAGAAAPPPSGRGFMMGGNDDGSNEDYEQQNNDEVNESRSIAHDASTSISALASEGVPAHLLLRYLSSHPLSGRAVGSQQHAQAAASQSSVPVDQQPQPDIDAEDGNSSDAAVPPSAGSAATAAVGGGGIVPLTFPRTGFLLDRSPQVLRLLAEVATVPVLAPSPEGKVFVPSQPQAALASPAAAQRPYRATSVSSAAPTAIIGRRQPAAQVTSHGLLFADQDGDTESSSLLGQRRGANGRAALATDTNNAVDISTIDVGVGYGSTHASGTAAVTSVSSSALMWEEEDDDEGSESEKDGSLPDRSSWPLLVRFRDCASPSDAHLAWTSLPVLPADVAPPATALVATAEDVDAADSGGGTTVPASQLLALTSPPPKAAVVQHILTLAAGFGAGANTDNPSAGSGAATDLTKWPYAAGTPVAVYSSLFKWLSSAQGWGQLAEGDRALIKASPLIPVGPSLYPTSRVFIRLPEPRLAPLLVEVPRAFGAYDSLLQMLGVEEAPATGHYARALAAYAAESGAAPLNVNELKTVVRVVEAVASAASTAASGVGSGGSVLWLPDSRGILTPSSRVVYDDNAWLAAQLRKAAPPSAGSTAAASSGSALSLTLSHPWLGPSVCSSLGIQPLSSRVEERLSPGQPLMPPKGMDESQALEGGEALAGLIGSHHMAAAIAILGAKVSGGGTRGPTTELLQALRSIGGGQPPSDAVAATAAAVFTRLSTLRVTLVERIETCLAVIGDSSSSSSSLISSSSSSCTACFLDARRRTLYISASSLMSVDAALVLARAISDALAALQLGGSSGTSSGTLASAAVVTMPHHLPQADLLRRTVVPALQQALAARSGSASQSSLEDGGAASISWATAVAGVSDLLRHPVAADWSESSEGSRGVPGQPLAPADASLTSLGPSRAFQLGEAVAWRDTNVRNSINDVASGEVLRYGLVEAATQSTWGALTKLRVRVGDDHTADLTSAEVLYFKPARSLGLTSQVTPHSAGATQAVRQPLAAPMAASPITPVNPAAPAAAPLPSINERDVLSAVTELMASLGTPLTSDAAQLLQEAIAAKRAAHQAQEEAAAARSEAGALKGQLEALTNSFICSICCVHEVDAVLVPCGHTICRQCASELRQPRCPFDRRQVTSYMPFYKPS